jgi:hypothetical protein
MARRAGRGIGYAHWMRPALVALGLRSLERLLLRGPGDAARASVLPRGWIGPRVDVLLDMPPEARRLLIAGSHHPHGEGHRVVRVCVRIEGQLVGRFALEQPGRFCHSLPLPAGLLSPVRVEIDSAPFFVPDEILHNGDPRRLCFHVDFLRPAA